MIASARSKCAESRKWLTSVRWDNPGHHHVPAEQPLRSAEREQADDLPAVALGDRAPDPEPQQARAEDEADQPAEQAVGEFPPIDVLECRERHSRRPVDLDIFGGRLVEVESAHPIGVAKRRDGSANWVPFGDRQAAFGEPRDSADDDHRKNHEGDEQQQPGERQRPGLLGGVRRGGV
jgi:hypothetical protein